MYGRDTGTLALAHRGGAGLAPENTLAAFSLATALGFRYLETDVRLTRDDRLVCFHDARLERVTNGAGPVRRQTLAALSASRVEGVEPIPTLADALEAFPEARFTVDLKERGAIAPLADLLRHRPYAERVCVAGAWDGWLTEFRMRAPHAHTALGWRALAALVSCSRTGMRPPRSVATGGFVHVPLRLGRVPVFAERLVQMAHDLGLRVVVWTVDDPTEMRALIDVGVDGVITDRPDLLREVLISRGEWSPMGGPVPVPAP